MSLAVDVGTRFVRLAHLDTAGRPVLADLAGAVPGEGLPVAPGQAGGQVLAAGCAAFRDRFGVPESVVLLCPDSARAECSRTIAEVFGSARSALPRLRPLHPAAAALALLRHDGQEPVGSWALCELGAAAVAVTVCAATPHGLALLGAVRRAPSGGFGAAFDDALVGAGPGGADAASLEALRYARRVPGFAERLDLAVGRAERNPTRYDDTPVLWVGALEVPAGTVRRALVPLREQLRQALAEATADATTDAPPVVVVGGMARLPAVRRLVGDPGRLVELPGGTDPALAAVLGAALVAAGRVDPADRYPYTVVVGTRRVRHGRLAAAELTLCPAGSLIPEAPAVFAAEGGRRVAVGGAGQAPREVEVWVRGVDGGPSVRVGSARLPASAPEERFHVGVALALDGRARLVLRPLGGGAPHEYPLGRLPGVLEEVRS
ncbi:hypothetical protein [Kitasatospora sp. GAS1066B]|uniref:hypothetical protein n=1 Tax=Kitasatospora sp. GAS1066B TaxID=3156271 RepID=UPI003518D233